MAPSYGWGSTASRLELLGGGSLKRKDSNSKEITHKVSNVLYILGPLLFTTIVNDLNLSVTSNI